VIAGQSAAGDCAKECDRIGVPFCGEPLDGWDFAFSERALEKALREAVADHDHIWMPLTDVAERVPDLGRAGDVGARAHGVVADAIDPIG
jgi:hypothetical protein